MTPHFRRRHPNAAGLVTWYGARSRYAEVWAAARAIAMTPEQVLSPLANRPYALRHAAVSLWLNAGVPATEVAHRAGHSVDVLLRVYASCLGGGERAANNNIGRRSRAGCQLHACSHAIG